MRKPCNQCPFLKTAPEGWLGNEKSTQIIKSTIESNEVFYCHKTVDYTENDGTVTDKTKVCAGSILLHKKEGRPNFLYRLLDDKITGELLIVNSAKEFIRLHSGNIIMAFLRNGLKN